MKKADKSIIIWLLSGCALIALMVIIGGITRLTQSGLSIVDWKPIMGTIPPMNAEDWQQAFESYKQSPEFILKNNHFDLEQFKSIFWWEFIHRLLGRIIGLVFIIPFIYFNVKERFSKKLLRQTLIILFLGGLQGVLGWYMVKSGLVNKPEVSHYRLAAHLITAFTAFAYTLWVALGLIFIDFKDKVNSKLKSWTLIILVISALQIIYGAFVAGLKAGRIYNTFPMMNDKWIAESIPFAFEKEGFVSFLENMATVQFIHRWLGIILFSVIVFLFFYSKKWNLTSMENKSMQVLLAIALLQLLLGIFTLIFTVPIVLGVIHQFGALMLLTAIIYNLYISRIHAE